MTAAAVMEFQTPRIASEETEDNRGHFVIEPLEVREGIGDVDVPARPAHDAQDRRRGRAHQALGLGKHQHLNEILAAMRTELLDQIGAVG